MLLLFCTFRKNENGFVEGKRVALKTDAIHWLNQNLPAGQAGLQDEMRNLQDEIQKGVGYHLT